MKRMSIWIECDVHAYNRISIYFWTVKAAIIYTVIKTKLNNNNKKKAAAKPKIKRKKKTNKKAKGKRNQIGKFLFKLQEQRGKKNRTKCIKWRKENNNKIKPIYLYSVRCIVKRVSAQIFFRINFIECHWMRTIPRKRHKFFFLAL